MSMSLEAENRSGLNGDKTRERALEAAGDIKGMANWPLSDEQKHCCDKIGRVEIVATAFRARFLANESWCPLGDIPFTLKPVIQMLLKHNIVREKVTKNGLGWYMVFTAYTRPWFEWVLGQSTKKL